MQENDREAGEFHVSLEFKKKLLCYNESQLQSKYLRFKRQLYSFTSPLESHLIHCSIIVIKQHYLCDDLPYGVTYRWPSLKA